ncbi:MAG: glycosyltransferase, partial [Acidimicrobiia bacterium]
MNRRRRDGAAQALAVGVPARNEAGRIERCLESISVAIEVVALPVVVVVCADSCTDETAAVATTVLRGGPAAAFAVEAADLGSAGAARYRACQRAIQLGTEVADVDTAQVWV